MENKNVRNFAFLNSIHILTLTNEPIPHITRPETPNANIINNSANKINIIVPP